MQLVTNYAHWKPVGTFLPQQFKSRLRETGTFSLMPKTLALMAVQRQTAASRSARPSMRVQQGVFGGVPTTTWTKSFNKSAQTPNLRVSLGQTAFPGGGFLWWCLGFGAGGQWAQVELTKVKKRRFRERRRAVVARAFEAISKTLKGVLGQRNVSVTVR